MKKNHCSVHGILEELLYLRKALRGRGRTPTPPKFKDFPPPIAIFKDFQGVEFLFENSRTFKMLANPIQRYHLLTHLFEESEDPGTDIVKR